MAVRKTPKGDKWCCDMQYKGQPRFYDTFDTESEARLRELEIKECMKTGVQPPLATTESFLKKIPTLSEVISRVKRDRWSHQSSSLHHNLSIDQFAAWVGADAKVTKITADCIADYVDYLRTERRLVDNTINKRLSSVRVVMGFCLENGYISFMPVIPHYKISEGRKRWLDFEEEVIIFSEFKKRKQLLFFQLLLETGCRIGEMHSINWDDIRGKTLWIWGVKSKGRKTRSMLLTDKALEVLAELGKDGKKGPIFKSSCKKVGIKWTGVGMSVVQLQKVFKECKNRAGFEEDEELTPHCLRHTCATRLVNAGVHARTIQSWLGHKDITTTLLYMHDDPANQKKAVKSLNKQRSEAAVPFLEAV